MASNRVGWQRYTEVVTRRFGNGRYEIALKPLNGFRGLGITSQEGGLLSTGAAVGTTSAVSSLAAGTALGAWAGPIGAGVGAVVGIIAGLWASHDARVKGATEENQIVGSAVQAWDQAMQAIFSAANTGQISGSQGAQMVSQLLASYWAAVAQAKGLPGVSDSSNGGGNCGSYTPGSTTRCTPSNHPACNKSCTVGCCVGCNDLWPSSLDAIAALTSPNGGTFQTCTVYSSGYGLPQRSGYSLSYKPPAPTVTSTAAQTGTAIASAAASAVGIAPTVATESIAGIPIWLLALGAAGFVLAKVL